MSSEDEIQKVRAARGSLRSDWDASQTMKTSKRRMIVKVQLPLVTSSPQITVLVYNRSRSVLCEFPITTPVRKALQGKVKSFWYAHLIPDPQKAGAFLVSLDQIAPWQSW